MSTTPVCSVTWTGLSNFGLPYLSLGGVAYGEPVFLTSDKRAKANGRQAASSAIAVPTSGSIRFTNDLRSEITGISVIQLADVNDGRTLDPCVNPKGISIVC